MMTVTKAIGGLLILAHSWYSSACCSGQDCKPIASCDLLVEQADGSFIYDGLKFPKEKIHPSQDAHCHVCIGNLTDDTGTSTDVYRIPYCAYIVQGA